MTQDEYYHLLFGLCRCGLVRRPVVSDKKNYVKLRCNLGHVKYIHKDH